MKKGYHSTQSKTFGTIPRSEFLGIALGYAIGMFFTGFFHMDGYVLEIVGAVIGFAAGWYVDQKYFLEKDVPVEEIEGTYQADSSEESA
ncbi:hypothetical protein [Butyricicoccus sp.]|uniref:hypothetical protein n=1 Tax=Butyricicoccus sp. TaxID=2049021 RepID=UPI003F18EA5F